MTPMDGKVTLLRDAITTIKALRSTGEFESDMATGCYHASTKTLANLEAALVVEAKPPAGEELPRKVDGGVDVHALVAKVRERQGAVVVAWRYRVVGHTEWRYVDHANPSRNTDGGYEWEPLYTHPAPSPEAKPAVSEERVSDGDLWSFLRKVMVKGCDLQARYVGGSMTYEHHSAHLDAEAAHFAKQLQARLRAAAPDAQPSGEKPE